MCLKNVSTLVSYGGTLEKLVEPSGLVKHNESQFPDRFAHWEPMSSWEHLNRCVREYVSHSSLMVHLFFCFFLVNAWFIIKDCSCKKEKTDDTKRVILLYFLQIAQCTVFSRGKSKYTETLKTQNQYLSQTATAQLHCASTCMKCYSARHLFKKPWMENKSKSLNSVQF